VRSFSGRVFIEDSLAHSTLRELVPASWFFLAVLAASVLLAAGCAHRTSTTLPPAPTPQQQPVPPPPVSPPAPEAQPSVPGEYVEEGVASWYGDPFNGHRTSDGEVYDMYQFTAAHRTLPFGSMVRVTNLSNGRQIDVRINDRGPFVASRIIDLSFSAARAIGMIGPGTAPVRLEVVSGPNPQVGIFGVQVGAFRSQANAERLQADLAARYSPVAVLPYESPNGPFYRVRVGRLPSEDAAQQLAAQLRADGHFATFVVRLDN
jgi:peptidoglycan lytic transglycosylase